MRPPTPLPPGSAITLIHTGGTLGMGPEPGSGNLSRGPSLDLILDQVPELKSLAQLRLVVISNRDSAANEPGDILELARTIRDEARSSRGIVLIHGTDTMAYTASVLGFLLSDLQIPVVLTGSQRPLALARSDARSNLIDAVTLACSGVAEVGIAFGDHWLRGVATEKVSVHRYEAFETPNLPPLAELGLHVSIHPHAGRFTRSLPKGLWALEPAIAVYTPHPGFPWHLPSPDARGVLIQAFGAGNLPMGRPDLQALLAHCSRQDLPVVITTQCLSGGVDLSIYEVGRLAAGQGCISGGQNTRWAALAKLSLCLGAGMNRAAIREQFGVSWAGEPV